MFRIEWPQAFVDFANGLRVSISIDFAEAFGSASCQLATSWFAVKTTLHLGLVYIIIISCFLAARVAEKLENKDGRNKLYAFISVVLFFSWPGMCVRVFQWFRCDEIEGTFYLARRDSAEDLS